MGSSLEKDSILQRFCATMHAMKRSMVWTVTLPMLLAAAGCKDTTPIPLDVAFDSTKDFKLLILTVKTLPDTDVEYKGISKNSGASGTVDISIHKSELRVGENRLDFGLTRSSFGGTHSAVLSKTWTGTPSELLRIYGTGGDAPGALVCGAPFCGTSSLKWNKDGALPLEIETAVSARVSLGDQNVQTAPGKRTPLSLQLWNLAGTASAADPEGKITVSITLEGEQGAKTSTTWTLSGPALTDVVARRFAAMASGAIRFPGEGDDRALDTAVVVGVKESPFVVLGQPKRMQDIDLIGVATESERDFACTGAAAGTSIVYHDVSVRVFERRTGKFVAEKKVSADRVACPPTSTGTRSQVYVRENDIKHVVGEVFKK